MICLNVRLKVRKGSEPEVLENFRRLQEASRREPGCRFYVAHQHAEDPEKFLVYEQYDDEAALEAHRSSDHFRDYAAGGVYRHVEEREADLYRPI